jgi:hypothetical protein
VIRQPKRVSPSKNSSLGQVANHSRNADDKVSVFTTKRWPTLLPSQRVHLYRWAFGTDGTTECQHQSAQNHAQYPAQWDDRPIIVKRLRDLPYAAERTGRHYLEDESNQAQANCGDEDDQ